VENARDILFQYELYPELRLTYMSPVVEEITGYPPEVYRRESKQNDTKKGIR